jgi:hypothetical protein
VCSSDSVTWPLAQVTGRRKSALVLQIDRDSARKALEERRGKPFKSTRSLVILILRFSTRDALHRLEIGNLKQFENIAKQWNDLKTI